MNNLLQKAKKLAIYEHRFQRYGEEPYHVHLEQVASVLIRYKQPYIVVVAGWLHDLIEDTPITYDYIKDQFGAAIADIVYAVTDAEGPNRRMRKKATYPKIRANRLALIVKLADRIANTKRCVETNISLLLMYAKEYPYFKKKLYLDNDSDDIQDMWLELDLLQKRAVDLLDTKYSPT